MGDVTITASDVRPLPGALCRRFDAGGAVYMGEAVYVASDGDVERADSDGSLSAQAIGIAVATPDGDTVVADGDPVDVCWLGPVAGYSSLTEGTPVYISGTAGQMTQDDVGAGTYEFIMGHPDGETVILVRPYMTSQAAKS